MRLNFWQRLAIKKLLGKEWLRWIMEAMEKFEEAGYGDRPPVYSRTSHEAIKQTITHLGLDKGPGPIAGEKLNRGDAVYLGPDGKYYRCNAGSENAEVWTGSGTKTWPLAPEPPMDHKPGGAAYIGPDGRLKGDEPFAMPGAALRPAASTTDDDILKGSEFEPKTMLRSSHEQRKMLDTDAVDVNWGVPVDEAKYHESWEAHMVKTGWVKGDDGQFRPGPDARVAPMIKNHGVGGNADPLPASDVTTRSGETMSIGGREIRVGPDRSGHLQVPDLMPFTVGKAPEPANPAPRTLGEAAVHKWKNDAKQGEKPADHQSSVDDKSRTIPYDDPMTGVRYASYGEYLAKAPRTPLVRYPD